MNTTSKVILAAIVVLVIVVAIVVIMGGKKNDQPSGGSTTGTSNTTTGAENANTDETEANGQSETTVVYGSDGFAPKSITVKAGSTIEFVNQTSDTIDPSSDPHPVHTDNPELNVGDIPAGSSKTITVDNTGTWGMHNHYNSSVKMTVIVQ